MGESLERLVPGGLFERVEEVGKVLVECNSENVGLSGGLCNFEDEVGNLLIEFNSENVGWSDAPLSMILSPETT